MGVSKNKGTPKWMVYNGKPDTIIFGNIHIMFFTHQKSLFCFNFPAAASPSEELRSVTGFPMILADDLIEASSSVGATWVNGKSAGQSLAGRWRSWKFF